MKAAEVEFGVVYIAKVSNRLTRVKILRRSLSGRGGWDALNVETGREVHIRTAGRLRGKARNQEVPGK